MKEKMPLGRLVIVYALSINAVIDSVLLVAGMLIPEMMIVLFIGGAGVVMNAVLILLLKMGKLRTHADEHEAALRYIAEADPADFPDGANECLASVQGHARVALGEPAV